jgi:ABC-type multidrug transport system ATPase subunit
VSGVHFDAVAKRFGRREVLRDFSASFPTGVTLLVGPNGSGKTTVLNLVAGVIVPDAGSIRVLDTPAATAKGRVFLAPSAAPAIPWLTGRAFIEFAASLFATRSPRPVIEHIVGGFGLAPHIDKPLGEMSSGTAKKMVIAAAFASGAPVLLFDEPTNELDAASITFFLEIVRDIGHSVIVIATHRTEQFDALAAGRVQINFPYQPKGD